MIGPTVSASKRVSEDRKQLTAFDLSLQERLQAEVCSHLYLEPYPTGYSGTLHSPMGYRCKFTSEDCLAKSGVLGIFALVFRDTEASHYGLDIKIAKRCPSRELE